MLSVTIANNTSVSTYDRSGRPLTLLRSEPAEKIAASFAQSSTTSDNYKDKVTLSEDGIGKSRQTDSTGNETAETGGQEESGTSVNGKRTGQGAAAAALTPAEEKAVRQLKTRDQEVKTHEMAHLASAGQFARGGPSYSYQMGPDGRRYAIGGEVPIDISQEPTPEATIDKMQAVRRAALAPAEPSATDRGIAAAAGALESRARSQLQAEQAKDESETAPAGNTPPSAEPESRGEEAPPLLRRTSLDVVA